MIKLEGDISFPFIKSVLIPLELITLIVLFVANSPVMLSSIIELFPVVIPTLSCIPDPKLGPFVPGVNTSPLKYPKPPLEIVAATATLFEIVISAVAFNPSPLKLLSVTPLKVPLVYPDPGLVIVNSPAILEPKATIMPDASSEASTPLLTAVNPIDTSSFVNVLANPTITR